MLAFTARLLFFTLLFPKSLIGFHGRMGEASSGSAMRGIAFQRFFCFEMGMVTVTKAAYVVQDEKQRGGSGSLKEIETLMQWTIRRLDLHTGVWRILNEVSRIKAVCPLRPFRRRGEQRTSISIWGTSSSWLTRARECVPNVPEILFFSILCRYLCFGSFEPWQ